MPTIRKTLSALVAAACAIAALSGCGSSSSSSDTSSASAVASEASAVANAPKSANPAGLTELTALTSCGTTVQSIMKLQTPPVEVTAEMVGNGTAVLAGDTWLVNFDVPEGSQTVQAHCDVAGTEASPDVSNVTAS